MDKLLKELESFLNELRENSTSFYSSDGAVNYCSFLENLIAKYKQEGDLIQMNNFYFVFDSDPQFPFRSEYIIIRAKTLTEAKQVFNALYPNFEKSQTLNCAFVYTEEYFNLNCRKYHTISDCRGVIDLTLKQI